MVCRQAKLTIQFPRRQGSMMTFGYSFNIWVPLLAFPTAGYYGAPRWRKGWPIAFVFYFLLWVGFITAIVIYRRYGPWGLPRYMSQSNR